MVLVMQGFVECYDVGGTNIRGALIDIENHINKPACSSCKTIKGSPQEFFKQIKGISKKMREEFFSLGYKPQNILAVSLGLPGPVRNNMLLAAPPMHISSSMDVVAGLKDDVKEPIFVENDMKAAVRAELKLGIGKKLKNFCLLTISTGIGVGVVADGNVIREASAEFGHIVLERDLERANKCSCGKYGCWVAQSSGYGIELLSEKFLKRKIDAKEFFDMYDSNDKNAGDIVEVIKDYNAHGIGNIVNVFYLDAIVVMGSIGLNRFKIVIPSKEEIGKYAINDVPRVVPTELGDDIGLLGAYMVARDNLKR